MFKMAAKSKRGQKKKANFVQQGNRITVKFKLVFVQVFLIPLLNCFISVSDQDSESYPQFSTRINILEIETESNFHSGVNLSKTNCKITESFNIYENSRKYPIGKKQN